MSEAVDLQSSYHTPDITHARQQRLKSTLIFLLKEFKESKQKLSEIQDEMRSIQSELTETKQKRKRLMSQNFSSAPHLKKAHTRYWDKLQQLKRLLQVKESQESYQLDKLYTLKEKIPETKDRMIQVTVN